MPRYRQAPRRHQAGGGGGEAVSEGYRRYRLDMAMKDYAADLADEIKRLGGDPQDATMRDWWDGFYGRIKPEEQAKIIMARGNAEEKS